MRRIRVSAGSGSVPGRARVFVILCGLTLPVLALDSSPAREACRRGAQTAVTLNVSSGVYTERAVASAPLTLRLPRGTASEDYAACLRLQGLERQMREDRFLRSQAECRQDLAAPRLERRAGGPLRVAGSPDRHEVDACIRARLQDIDVQLEPPPAPPAAGSP